MTSTVEQLSVKVTVDGEARLKIVWSRNGLDIDPYFIDREVIQECSQNVRRQLRALVKDYMSREAGEASGRILKDVAAAGYDLYRALFLNAGNSIADPEQVRTWLAAMNGPKRISFTVDDRVHIPWGLIYDADPNDRQSRGYLSGQPNEDEIERFQAFWCLKYQVSAVYSMVTALSIHEPPRAEVFKMLSVVNQGAFDGAMANLADPEDKILAWLQQTFGAPLNSSQEFFNQWKSVGKAVNLLYFYCHARGNSLSLDVDDLFTTSALKLNIRRSGAPKDLSTCVVFINGCSTATGDPKGGFLEATGSSGLCGFIGTETVVPDVFALRFGLAFLFLFIHKGLPVFEVMDTLRTKHWPLSLIYSTYCYPDLRIEPIGDPNELAFQIESNFSRLPLGTKEMQH